MTQALPVLLSTLAGTVLGALIAWLLMHLYARLSLREMRKQRDHLERYNRTLTQLLKSWEDQGHVELSRDARTDISGGRVLSAATGAMVESSAHGAHTPRG